MTPHAEPALPALAGAKLLDRLLHQPALGGPLLSALLLGERTFAFARCHEASLARPAPLAGDRRPDARRSRASIGRDRPGAGLAPVSACSVPAELVSADGGCVAARCHVGADGTSLAAPVGSTRSLHLAQPLDLTVGLLEGLGVGEGLTPAERKVAQVAHLSGGRRVAGMWLWIGHGPAKAGRGRSGRSPRRRRSAKRPGRDRSTARPGNRPGEGPNLRTLPPDAVSCSPCGAGAAAAPT